MKGEGAVAIIEGAVDHTLGKEGKCSLHRGKKLSRKGEEGPSRNPEKEEKWCIFRGWKKEKKG